MDVFYPSTSSTKLKRRSVYRYLLYVQNRQLHMEMKRSVLPAGMPRKNKTKQNKTKQINKQTNKQTKKHDLRSIAESTLTKGLFILTQFSNRFKKIHCICLNTKIYCQIFLVHTSSKPHLHSYTLSQCIGFSMNFRIDHNVCC